MIIIITRPEYFTGEAETVNRMFQLGLERLHIRKPESSEADLESLIQQIERQYHHRLVLHDHHRLAVKYELGGIHLNGRNPLPLSGFDGTVSCSCHSIDELKSNPHSCAYRTLSPIFDSISKQGYRTAFTPEELRAAADTGIIDSSVYALGGVTVDRLPLLKGYGFGGALLLGEPWRMAAEGELERYMGRLIPKAI